ncbi:hypothetical protein [Kitasatospora sp. NBC_00458]|uniref:hypothetical protein n=1 Tax=Kitasatospora sp. NBC_00458 TaxID=2903568 RepID=UPI002E1856C5
MHAKNRTLLRGVLVTAVLLGFTAATPALAEGSWTSHISKWGPGSESRRWADSDRDDTVTTVALQGCNTDTNDFRNADLALFKDVFGPDKSYGYRLNHCNTSAWGDQSAGDYYFALEGVRGGGQLWVDTVSTRY